MGKWIGTTVVAALVLALLGAAAHGQSCAGDFDFDHGVTANDVPEGTAVLFGKFGAFESFTPVLKAIADVNGDGTLTVADLTATAARLGTACGGTATPTSMGVPTATPTPTRSGGPTATPTSTLGTTPGTPTRTPTPRGTATPSHTFTRPPTPTATPTCPLQAMTPGTTSGSLTAADCRVSAGAQSRFADGYALAVPAVGVAVRVDVTGTGIAPFLVVRDPGGQFFSAQGEPPIEFVASTTLPYEVYVTSKPGTVAQAGDYTLSVSTRACPTPVALTTSATGELTAAACPEPAAPSVGTNLNPADQYVVTIAASAVPVNLHIQMAELSNSDVDPEFAVIGPDGYELLYAADDNLSADGFGEDARFLAWQPGQYTIIASGFGGLGKYRMQLASLPQCRTTALPAISEGSPGQVAGTLYGATLGAESTSCAAPLRPPTSEDDVPEPNGSADVYTFDASAGDVVSVLMESEDDPYLFLVGPTDCSRAPAGCVSNRLLASDDDSGQLGGSSAQIAVTIVHPGTYLLIATNAAALFPPADGDPGDSVAYTLFTQRCPPRGRLTVNAAPRSATFDSLSCHGPGGVPVAAYTFNGVAGSFVTASVAAATFDGFVRLIGADGVVVANDNDPFAAGSADALVGRILPSTGTYVVEASASTAQAAPPPSPAVAFTIGVQSCSLTDGTVGAVGGSLAADDCTLPNGRRFDVYRYVGPSDAQAADVISVAVPQGVCAAAVLASGMQVPVDQCATGVFQVPLLPGRSGLVVAGAAAGQVGPYSLEVARCSATPLGFGTVVNGMLSGSDCANAADLPAKWFLVRAPTGLVTFQSNGAFGRVTAGFSLGTNLTDAFGTFAPGANGFFIDDSGLMYTFGADLGLLVQVQGTSAADSGAFTVNVAAGDRRQ